MKQSTLNFKELQVDGYEKVVEIRDESRGLHAIIALHNTTLGPGLGGIRAYPYANFEMALTDVLRLSRGMTYKAAVTETGTGGGKSVIIIDPKHKTKDVLLAFAEAVNIFEGKYICAEDIGVTVEDLAVVRQNTRYAVGIPHPKSSGDPSPYTSWGGFRGIQAACKKIFGTTDLSGRRMAIQGLGAVGMKLSRLLFWAGAKLIVTDVDSNRCQIAAKEFGALVVSPADIYDVECDVFVPCAMGGIINPSTIPRLRCKAVAGLANNQLLTDADGESLNKKGILYAPDYVINAGGLINVCSEIDEKGYNPESARNGVDKIFNVLLNIFTLSEEKNKSTHQIAQEIAESNLAKSIGKREKQVIFHH